MAIEDEGRTLEKNLFLKGVTKKSLQAGLAGFSWTLLRECFGHFSLCWNRSPLGQEVWAWA